MPSITESPLEVVAPVGHTTGSAFDGRRVVAAGSYRAIYERFDAELWTDGLPFVPPTVDAVDRMLATTTRDTRQIIGIVAPEYREATVWITAVNAVMAGVRDQDFPVALAVAEALVDSRFRIADAGSTTGWEPLVVLSGPELEVAGFNALGGAMRTGRRANATIGRFVRLFLRNVGGLLSPPGETDMAAIGQPTFGVMAENDEAVKAIGWSPLRVAWGFGDGDVALAVQGIVGSSTPIYSSGARPESHLGRIADAIGRASAANAGLGTLFGSWSPVLAMSPGIAQVFATAGLDRADVAKLLAEEALAPVDHVEAAVEATIGRQLSSSERDQMRSEAVGDLLRVILDPTELAIVLTGEPGRNQSKYYVPVGLAGKRVVRRVDA